MIIATLSYGIGKTFDVPLPKVSSLSIGKKIAEGIAKKRGAVVCSVIDDNRSRTYD